MGTTIGYKEWQPYFKSSKPEEEIIQRWKYSEHAFARRQMIWFKKNLRQAFDGEFSRSAQGEHKKIEWFKITELKWKGNVVKLVKNWYSGI